MCPGYGWRLYGDFEKLGVIIICVQAACLCWTLLCTCEACFASSWLYFAFWVECFLYDELQSVVELIKHHFGDRKPHDRGNVLSTIPLFPVPSHNEPHFSCFAEAEADGVSVNFILFLVLIHEPILLIFEFACLISCLPLKPLLVKRSETLTGPLTLSIHLWSVHRYDKQQGSCKTGHKN